VNSSIGGSKFAFSSHPCSKVVEHAFATRSRFDAGSGTPSKGAVVRVLGLDPGVAVSGFAVIEKGPGGPRALSVGAIRTPAVETQAVRLLLLRRELEIVIEEHTPDVLAIERVFFNANARTAMAVGQAAGVALVTAAAYDIEVTDYTPTEVKQAVVGIGNATKPQVQAMVSAVLRLPAPPKPADAADACALAVCHINRSALARAVGAAR
jgi:crossover junction endodeoxyribonuclease RuvC